MRGYVRLAVAGALLAGLVAAGSAFGEVGAPLPKDFRSWRFVRSMVIPDKSHGMYGFHYVWANKAAAAALESGAAFPEGAAFVASIFEVNTENGTYLAGKKRRDVIQRKDKSAAATGGWSFAAFGADGKPVEIDAVEDCYGCHKTAGRDHVFARFTE